MVCGFGLAVELLLVWLLSERGADSEGEGIAAGGVGRGSGGDMNAERERAMGERARTRRG